MSDNNPNPYAAGVVQAQPVRSDVEDTRHKYLSHEASVKSIGVLYILGGIFGTLAGVAYLVMGVSVLVSQDQMGGELPPAAMGGIFIGLGILVLALSIGQVVVAVGFRKLAAWSRIPGAVIAAFGLLGFPIGTLISAYIMYLLLSQKGAMVFSPQYKEVMEQTPHIKYKTSIIVWIFLILVLSLIVIAIGAALFAG